MKGAVMDPFSLLVDAIADRVVEKLGDRIGNSSPARSVRLPEAAVITGLSKTTLRNMITCGDLPAHRKDSVTLIKVSDIDAWVDRSKIRQ